MVFSSGGGSYPPIPTFKSISPFNEVLWFGWLGADFSFMSIALPNQTLWGKPFKITYSNLKSLDSAVSAIKKCRRDVFVRKSYLSRIHGYLPLPTLLLLQR